MAHGFPDSDGVLAAVVAIDVEDYSRRAGVGAGLVRAAARRIGTAAAVSILEDLGIQQGLHSTLNSYLEKLLWALTGNFARPGCTNLHTHFSPGGRWAARVSRVAARRAPGNV